MSCHLDTSRIAFPLRGNPLVSCEFRSEANADVQASDKPPIWLAMTLMWIHCSGLGQKRISTSSSFVWVQFLGVIFVLTHWGRDKIGAISPTTVSRAFILNEHVRIPIEISLTFVPRCSINNIQSLVQKMSWPHSGDKALSGPAVVSLVMQIWLTRPQWVRFGARYKLLNDAAWQNLIYG